MKRSIFFGTVSPIRIIQNKDQMPWRILLTIPSSLKTLSTDSVSTEEASSSLAGFGRIKSCVGSDDSRMALTPGTLSKTDNL